jgi:uncharacterized protein YjbI with pentapeptide repeats
MEQKKPGWTREQLEDICKNRRKNFRGLKLHGAVFDDMDLEKADFRGAICHYASFKRCNCRFMNAEGAGFMFTQWEGADCHRMNAREAQLCDADMRGVKDFYGITLTMECRTLKGLRLDPGFWYGFLFYGLLMEPPSEEEKEKLQLFLGPERFETLRNLYATRQM